MPIAMSEKKIINGRADMNVLIPIKYKFGWESYLSGCANNWMPTEVPMQKDIEQWKSKDALTESERKMFTRNMQYFSTAESLTSNNLVLAIYRLITNPECRQYILRQAFEEALHIHTFVYIVEALGLDQDTVFEGYKNIETIEAKDNLCFSYTEPLMDPNFNTGTPETDLQFLKSMFVFSAVLEGIGFYSSFAQILALGRRNLMPGCSQMLQYIMRDEVVHIKFGLDVVNTVIEENPHLWTNSVREELREIVREAIRLEDKYAEESSAGVLGFNVEDYKKYARYNADNRLKYVNIEPLYNQRDNPMQWLSEMGGEVRKEVNFFEGRVTEYQTGTGLKWDD